MSHKPIRVYHLYPTGSQISCRTEDYSGTVVTVAATSIRQAYAVAHKRSWINPEHSHPVGIVSIHGSTERPVLWCGCEDYDGLAHGAGVTALRAAIARHKCRREQWQPVLAAPATAKVVAGQPELPIEGEM